MRRFASNRCALGICAAVVILGGCGKLQTTIGVPEARMLPAKSFFVVYRFAGGPHDGASPTVGLIDVKGTLYGTTSFGGPGCAYGLGCGTVFSLSTAGSEKVLHRFRGGRSDGKYPEAALIDVKGTLYGTTSYGGAG
ncbi:MAG: hypothetical protein JO104_12035, partial [Candidatus Eremiobacteraeota bacterium]|nr:hypothetical protein [Candidatus Eremiobacteraeota bacterium]